MYRMSRRRLTAVLGRWWWRCCRKKMSIYSASTSHRNIYVNCQLIFIALIENVRNGLHIPYIPLLPLIHPVSHTHTLLNICDCLEVNSKKPPIIGEKHIISPKLFATDPASPSSAKDYRQILYSLCVDTARGTKATTKSAHRAKLNLHLCTMPAQNIIYSCCVIV